MARLRNRRFFSLGELNRTIAELVAGLNARPMRRLGVSRRELFLELDRPALKELPAEPDEYAEWRPRRLGRDYHVDIDRALLLGAVPADPRAARCPHHRATRSSCSARAERVAVPLRGGGRHTPIPEHMPSAHRPLCRLDDRAHPRRRRGHRPEHRQNDGADPRELAAPRTGACIGILRLARHYGAARLEAACDRGSTSAPALRARSNRSSSTASTGGGRRRSVRQGELLPDHPNIRGPRYYH